MHTELLTLESKLTDSYTITRTQRRMNTLLIFMRDTPTKYEATLTNNAEILLKEINTMGSGTIGGYYFDTPTEAAAFIKSQ